VSNWGTGRPTREFLHVDDAARAIALAAARWDDPAPVNIGTGRETSIAELSRIVAEAAGFTGVVGWDATKPDGQPRRYLDVSKATQFGFEAEIALEDGVAETVAWYQENL
jgi:GDP-L-fucose synthase